MLSLTPGGGRRPAPAMGSVEASPEEGLRHSPEGFIVNNGVAEVIAEEIHLMDTSPVGEKTHAESAARAGRLCLTDETQRSQPTNDDDDQACNAIAAARDPDSHTAAGATAGRESCKKGHCVHCVCDPRALCGGWTFEGPRRGKQKKLSETEATSQRGPRTPGKPEKPGPALTPKQIEDRKRELKAQHVARVNAKMTRAARMPPLAKKNEHRIVIRPRGGLVVGSVNLTELKNAISTAARIPEEIAREDSLAVNNAQNIIVLGTPNEERSYRYGAIRSLTIKDRTYEAYGYKCTPDNTSRGVISRIGPEDSDEDIVRYLANDDNPTVMTAHRLGKTTSVVILFDGDKVPYYVKYNGVIAKCTLYKQHREVCTTCRKVGHRRDVCPTPHVRVCFACGRRNPDEEHKEYCKPRCTLCGGDHITGGGSCKNKFKVPMLIRKRMAAKIEREETKTKMAPNNMVPQKKASNDVPPATQARRSRSKSRNRTGGLTWAEVTSGEEKGEGQGTRQRSLQRSLSRHRSPSHHRSTSRGDRKDTPPASAGSRCKTPARDQPPTTAKTPVKNKLEGRLSTTTDDNDETKKEIRELKSTNKRLEKELQELKAIVEAQRLTIHQLKNLQDETTHACRVSHNAHHSDPSDQAEKEMEEDKPDQETDHVGERPRKKKTKKRARTREEAKLNNRDLDSEVEEGASETDEEETGDMATETEPRKEGARPIGYASHNARIARVENLCRKWDRNFEELKQKMIQRQDQLYQRDVAQQIERARNQTLQEVGEMIQQAIGQLKTELLKELRSELTGLLKAQNGQTQ